MNVNQTPTTAQLIETHGQVVRQVPFTTRAKLCGCCGQLPLYDCGGVLLCARCDTDASERQ